MQKVIRNIPLAKGDELDLKEWRDRSPDDKLETLQELRDVYYQFKNESRKRFRRVYRITKLT